MELNVNGRKFSLRSRPGRRLLDVLRDELGLTGTKYGCGEGQCGACTVLIDGKPVRSCLTTAAQAEGKQILTIEGLTREGALHPVQQAFLEADAFQCGYCTPGMILATAALLQARPEITPEEAAQALQGHICRCGVYPRILDAVRIAAERSRGGRTRV